MRTSIAGVVVLALVSGAAVVAFADDPVLTDVVFRQELDTMRLVENSEPSNGVIVRQFSIERLDEFANGSSNYIVTVDGVEMLALDPEDLGFSTITGVQEGVTNVGEVLDAAAAKYPDVSYWGANWEPSDDPAEAVWQQVGDPGVRLQTGEAATLPVVLGPGESFELFTGFSITDTVPETPPPALLNGELVVGFTLSGSVVLIPEPCTLCLLGTGVVGLAVVAWRRRRA